MKYTHQTKYTYNVMLEILLFEIVSEETREVLGAFEGESYPHGCGNLV